MTRNSVPLHSCNSLCTMGLGRGRRKQEGDALVNTVLPRTLLKVAWSEAEPIADAECSRTEACR